MTVRELLRPQGRRSRSGGIPGPTVKVRMGGSTRAAGDAQRERTARHPRNPSRESTADDRGPDDHQRQLRRGDAPRVRARRAGSGRRRQPAGRVRCCWTPRAAIVAEGWHRGAGTPHAEVDALSQAARAHPTAPRRPHRRRHARALQPHRPHRPVQRRAHRRRRRARRLRDQRSRPRSRGGGAERLRDGGVDVDRRRARRRGRGASCTSGSPRCAADARG